MLKDEKADGRKRKWNRSEWNGWKEKWSSSDKWRMGDEEGKKME